VIVLSLARLLLALLPLFLLTRTYALREILILPVKPFVMVHVMGGRPLVKVARFISSGDVVWLGAIIDLYTQC